VIDGLEYPRHFLPVTATKGYLTDGNFTGRVYVIDTGTLKITDTLSCGSGPEKMVLYQDKVFVANSGGWGNDSTLTVIDIATDKVTATWVVGDNPADLVIDKSNQLWVLCKGRVVWNADWTIGEETTSSLSVVDPASGVVSRKISIGMVGDYFWPQRMCINAARDHILLLESDGVHSIANTSSSASQVLIPGYFYGFGCDPATDQVYVLHAPSFTTAGWLYRYKPDGLKIDSLEVGIGPSQVVFN
jgi:YVTN family beta-propeller protein